MMDKLTKYAQHFVKLELMKARFEVFQNESANRGVEFIVKTETGKYHELYLQPINLEKDRSVKITYELFVFKGVREPPKVGFQNKI